jgi:hypothetical protein
MITSKPCRTAVRGGSTWLIACLACSIFEFSSTGLAYATGPIGVGIQAEPLILSTTAQPGHTYRFPTFYVINTGGQTITARFAVELFNTGARHVPPASWFSFPITSVQLRPGATDHVSMTLRVPIGAVIGSYQSDVVVHATAIGAATGAGATVAAAAATKIEFTVATEVSRSTGRTHRWLLPLGIFLGVLVAVYLIWRSGLRLTVKKP